MILICIIITIMQQKKVSIIHLIIFILKITFIGFGGGNALMPIIKKEAVDKRKWITNSEFDDIVIVTNMLPGASVIQTISYICIHLLGKFKGILVTLFAILPHVLIAFVFLILSNYLPKEYIKILSIGVLISIISFLIDFGMRYLKQSQQSIYTPLWLVIFLFSFIYCFFVPSPYNIPVVAILFVMIIYTFLYFYLKKKNKKIILQKGEE